VYVTIRPSIRAQFLLVLIVLKKGISKVQGCMASLNSLVYVEVDENPSVICPRIQLANGYI